MDLRRAALSLLVAAMTAPLGGSAVANHVESKIGPGEPRREFSARFMGLLPDDKQQKIAATPKWEDPRIGGWGPKKKDRCHAKQPRRRPVIFVHGTTEDAWFWRTARSEDAIVNVRWRFRKGGYCAKDLWAISYTGAKGYFTYNDINTSELHSFIDAVRSHTGAPRVDIVAHSLGVTVFRKAAFRSPGLFDEVANFVAIAGANHGTTTCESEEGAEPSHVCEEIRPGSEWLEELNSTGETPSGPNYLTIYDGTGTTDQFYLGDDGQSPRLEGACNFEMPFVAHNTLARGAEPVGIYLRFLRDGTLPDCTD